MEDSLNDFERDPRDASFTKKWIMGWRWKSQRAVTRWTIQSLGNRFVTGFYRVAGAVFLAFLVLQWILLVILIARS
jgi:hypothetical protein